VDYQAVWIVSLELPGLLQSFHILRIAVIINQFKYRSIARIGFSLNLGFKAV